VGRGFLDIYPAFCRINRGLFELATARKLARQLNTSAFVGTIQTSELITSGLPVIQQLSRQNTLSLTI
jgi:hypothetical protein